MAYRWPSKKNAHNQNQVANESESKPLRWRWLKETNPVPFQAKDINRNSEVLKDRLKNNKYLPSVELFA